MNAVTGRVPVTIAGEQRILAVDMEAADAFYADPAFGEHWAVKLYALYLGAPTRQKGAEGKTELRFTTPPLAPADLMRTVHAMLAGDRLERGYSESLQDLRAKVGPFDLPGLKEAATRAVTASLGIPGEEVEIRASANPVSPQQPGAKRKRGTGTRR